ncbi:leucine-rich repeat protein, partial [bacterium]|nr:leucine-rich repeat protein [bacterium]
YTSADIPTQTIDGKEYMIMYEGETGHIQILVAGEDKTKDGVYTSGNTTILTVENTEENPGLIRAIKKGDTTITLHHDEALEGDVVVNVKVKEKPTLITTELNIILGYTEQIVIKNLSGEDITNKFTFTSADTSIATVDQNGKVTLKQEHNTTITATYNDGMRVTTYTIPVKAQKTLTTNAGITATALSASQTQEIITILMDTGMISNENDVDNVVRIDTTNGLTEIKITIDREDGTQVAVVAYENGKVKYIQTGEVQNKQVTVNVGTSNQNVVATQNTDGSLETYVVPGFYDDNNTLLLSWQTAVNTGWAYSTDFAWNTANQQSNHFYKKVLVPYWNQIKTATKLVIPDGITKIGSCAFSCYNYTDGYSSYSINLNTIVFPNSYTAYNIGSSLHDIKSDPMLTNYTIRSDNPTFDSIDGVIYTENHQTLVVCPMNKTKLTVLNNTTYIYNAAFEGNKTTSIGPYDSGADILVPNTVTSIGGYVFGRNRNLKWVELWNGLQTCGGEDFTESTVLKSIYMPSTLKNITVYNNGVGICGFASSCTNVQFYLEATSVPSGWQQYWNIITHYNLSSGRNPKAYNVSRTTYRNNYRN